MGEKRGCAVGVSNKQDTPSKLKLSSSQAREIHLPSFAHVVLSEADRLIPSHHHSRDIDTSMHRRMSNCNMSTLIAICRIQPKAGPPNSDRISCGLDDGGRCR
ncbi:hypothetical protein QCA50_006259 [Cerrena zonata]|uniref:Uncharacterized protein n=1 Tax=Cerrena zonata TaxID=2478898 RepID=A0AAW0GNR9_9APHY